MNPLLLAVFVVIISFMSAVYFYLFSRNEEQFLQYWGFAWLAYAASLLLVIIYLTIWKDPLALEMRKLFDMANCLIMLMGVYSFSHSGIPGSWMRFSIYMTVLSLLCALYRLDLYSFYLPISLYQICMGAVMCWYITTRWDLRRAEKIIAVISFGIWTMGKPLLSMYELNAGLDLLALCMELVLANILNFCLLIVYAQNHTVTEGLADSIYGDVIENTSDVIFYYNCRPFPHMRYITPSVRELTGYSQKSFYEDPRLLTSMVEESHAEELRDVLAGQLTYDRGQVLRITKKDGTYFWGDIRTVAIPDGEGGTRAVEGMIRDISDMKNLQLEQIAERNRHDQLLSYISHELRTPVTSMAGYLSAINDGILTSPEDIKEVLTILASRTMVLKELISDLDQMSKMETGRFSFDFVVSDALSLSREMAGEDASDAESAGFTLDVTGLDLLPDDAYVAADEGRLRQVFRNLLSNAMKYSEPGTKITVSFEVSKEDSLWSVSVTDEGPGIDDAELIHVFDRFYRGSDTDKTHKSGRGLGLALSKDIVEAHRGTIDVWNNQGRGCTFRFEIPLIDDPII